MIDILSIYHTEIEDSITAAAIYTVAAKSHKVIYEL